MSGRGASESYIMAKGSNSRSNKEVKKPKKDKSKDKAAADSNRAPVFIAGKQMK